MEKILNQLQNYNFWFSPTIKEGYIRKTYINKINKFLNNSLVKVLIGQRRVGKSYIMRQIISLLIQDKKVNPKNIFYLNKEFIGFETINNSTQLNLLFNLYKEKISPTGKIYIFIDEIQTIENWELFVNSYSQDYTSEYELFITGSNSNLLSGELATYLSGRYIEFSIFSLSYKEFTEIQNKEIGKISYLNYLQTGGMPELINLPTPEIYRNYVEGLKNTIIIRDIVSRYSIKDMVLFEILFRYLMSNIGNLTSVTNIVKYFKNLNKTTNYETIANYIHHLTDSLIFHETERFDIRGKQILNGVKKYYLNDLCFKNYLLGFSPSDIGYNLENLIYKQLLENNYTVNIGEIKNTEIDFVAQKENTVLYVQVAYLLDSENTIDREFGNLEKIPDNFQKIVVSLDDVRFSNRNGIMHFRPWELDWL